MRPNAHSYSSFLRLTCGDRKLLCCCQLFLSHQTGQNGVVLNVCVLFFVDCPIQAERVILERYSGKAFLRRIIFNGSLERHYKLWNRPFTNIMEHTHSWLDGATLQDLFEAVSRQRLFKNVWLVCGRHCKAKLPTKI